MQNRTLSHPIRSELLPFFNNDLQELNEAIQPVFIGTDDDDGTDFYVPAWQLSRPELADQLDATLLTYLGLLYHEMTGDLDDILTNLYDVTPIEEP